MRYKWRELTKEYTDLKELEETALRVFYEAAMKYIKKNDLEDPFVAKEQSKKNKNTSILQEDEIKILYMQAAIQTHPDKHGGEYVDIFKDIARAKNEGNLNQVLEGARRVDVRPHEISIKQIDVLEEELNELEKKIDEIRSSVHWVWYHANNTRRQKILEYTLNSQHA